MRGHLFNKECYCYGWGRCLGWTVVRLLGDLTDFASAHEEPDTGCAVLELVCATLSVTYSRSLKDCGNVIEMAIIRCLRGVEGADECV